MRAVFFDRDGTLNVDVEYLHRVEDFRWIEEAKEAIKYVNDLGYLAIVVTNQSGVARGFYPESDIELIHDYMNDELKKIGAHIDAFYYCPHHPEAKVEKYRVNCDCRKPKTGMVDRACAEFSIEREGSFMVGDSERDLVCGRTAGLTPIAYTGGSLLARLKNVIKK